MRLKICVILGQDRKVGPGERRLLASLTTDARYSLVSVTELPCPKTSVPPFVRAAIALEHLVFRWPDQGPALKASILAFDEVRTQTFDVVVDFSGNPSALDLVTCSRDGVWRLSASEDGAGYAEARDWAPITTQQLFRHTAHGAAEVIAIARYDTKFIASHNACFIKEKSVQLVTQALARLSVAGSVDALSNDITGVRTESRRFGSLDLPYYVARTAYKIAIRALHEIGERTGRRPGMFILRAGYGDAHTFDPISAVDIAPEGNVFWADPFLLEHQDGLFVFYEEYDYSIRRGHISVGRLEGDHMIPVGVALQRPYHLSYPFVFRWQDQILMIPETHEANRLEIWRATNFPLEWELASTALEGTEACDVSVFEWNEEWWMLANICQDSFHDFCSELHLFRVDGPMLNQITPHPLNPVVIDATTARGGGRVFERDGRLYRTSQDNSHGVYGFGLNLMEITRLDETGFEERCLKKFVPDFLHEIMAVHHVDAAAGRFVIDARRQAMGATNLRGRKPQHALAQEGDH